MAHKKGQGSVRNGRDSVSKRLGVKAFGGEFVTAGSIIVRQRGTKSVAGNNVGTGRDWTLSALVDGKIKFDKASRRVNIVPQANATNNKEFSELRSDADPASPFLLSGGTFQAGD